MGAVRGAERGHQGRLGELGDIADGPDPERFQPGQGGWADAPEPAERERVQERVLLPRLDDQQPIGLR